MACVDSYRIDPGTGAKQLLKHFSVPTGATVKNQTTTLAVSKEISVELLNLTFTTAPSDAYLESGTNDPIAMVVTYLNLQGMRKELVVANLRDHVISEGMAFATGSTTTVQMLLRDIASVQAIRLMPYNDYPYITAGWKPSHMVVSLGADGSVQMASRAIDTYIQEDRELDPNYEIIPAMVGGLQISLANIIVTTDVSATNAAGFYGNSYRVSSADNKTINLTVDSAASLKVHVTVANSEQGYAAKAEQIDGVKDISGLISRTADGFVLSMPVNRTGQDQTYQITVSATENETISVTIVVTLKSEEIMTPTEEPTQPPEPTEVTEPTEATEPSE